MRLSLALTQLQKSPTLARRQWPTKSPPETRLSLTKPPPGQRLCLTRLSLAPRLCLMRWRPEPKLSQMRPPLAPRRYLTKPPHALRQLAIRWRLRLPLARRLSQTPRRLSATKLKKRSPIASRLFPIWTPKPQTRSRPNHQAASLPFLMRRRPALTLSFRRRTAARRKLKMCPLKCRPPTSLWRNRSLRSRPAPVSNLIV
ncbi:Uncharacterised protein [Klebsiella pneumoniae]|nr:Uncharacterised protein [Klebsiella pneumoniae]